MSDQLIFLIVLALRFFVPLAIPRVPLPAIIACLVLDGIDQSIFQLFTDLDLTGYQSYDKALDIYYLSIAYLSTIRNWTNLEGFKVSRFLFYYRLVGVVLFEYTQQRWLLVLFPNTFEYFFIFYEAVRLRWNPDRMSRGLLIGAAAAIWIVIKLPQEYWIHVAQLDFTDTLRAYPALLPIIVIALVIVVGVAWWVITRRLPAADHPPSLVVDSAPPESTTPTAAFQFQSIRNLFDAALLEKFILVSLVSIIFAQILPGVEATAVELSLAVAYLIVTNTIVSEWLARRGVGWASAAREFVVMAVINAALVAAALLVLPSGDGSINVGAALFFLLLLTLLVTLYDRFRPYYLARTHATAEPELPAQPAP
jgi:hypothetical protein